MRKYKFVILLLIGFAVPLKAQLFNAGPDQTVCSGAGADLGTNAVIPATWCITWSPAEGLDDIHSARPHANPKKTTTYVASVLTDNWESVSTDEVKVSVGFGGIKFNPPYLNQGSDETSQATLTINPDGDQVTWSIEGDAKGASIDAMSGVITPGTDYGKITIRATKTQHPACYAEETIEINEGVKDLVAKDASHPGRMAMDGADTLYLVGESSYVVDAVPNESGFKPGTPLWYNDGTPDAIVPGDGEIHITGSLSTEHHFSAGSSDANFQPKVIIKHINTDEFQIDLGPLIQSFTDKLKSINDKLKEKIAKKFPSVPNLSVEVNLLAMKYKRGNVELYNNPGKGYKYAVEAGGNMAISGKLYHPQFTQLFDLSLIGIVAGTELYLEPYFESSLTGSVVKDASKENPDWTFINPMKLNATGGIRGVFNVVGTGAGYSLEGGFSLNSEIGFDLTFNPSNGELRLKITLSPLQGITKVLVERYVDPKKKWTFFNYTVDLLDKWTSPDFLIYNF